jgi:hypothetical protein
MKNIKEASFRAQEKEIIGLWQKARGERKLKILNLFKQRIKYLQNERLVHLFVTLFFGGASLFLAPLALKTMSTNLLLVFILILISAACYVIHYYILENTCQRWQRLAIEMEKELLSKTKK